MKVYRVSKRGRLQAGIILAILGLTLVYSSRKAVGLWGGATAKASDPLLFGLNLNTTVAAFLLSLVALGCLSAAWYILVEMLSQLRLDDSGLLLTAPGYRLFYRWNEIVGVEVLNEPEEDSAACLQVVVAKDLPASQTPDVTDEVSAAADEITAYLTQADLQGNRIARRRQAQARRQQLVEVQARALTPDGRRLPAWRRWLYPQSRRPDRLLLYPLLDDRAALLAEVEHHLAGV